MLGLSSLSHELSDQIATILDATLLVVLVSPALRIGVKNLTVDHLGQLIGPVTVSMGIAMFPDQGTSAEELITAADEALYTAKRNGRDQIILEAADLVELSPS
jgi:diguanylate cyclase (GGDEF)-like protein